MMSSNRGDYASASEWLSALRQDEAWLTQQQRLMASETSDVSIHREDAIRRIGRGDTFEFWEIYGHQVEKVVCEVWEMAELSLPKLKIQAIGMLSMEWLEQMADTNKQSAFLEMLEKSELWQKLKDAGLVDENGQPTVSRPEAALMADILAERLGITNKWKQFGQLWHRNNMRNDYNTALNQRKSLEFQDRVKNILG